MNEALLIALVTIFPFSPLTSQTDDEKRDHVWLFGYADGYTNPPPHYGNAQLDFNLSPPDLFATGGYANFAETNSSICDKDGNLLFYTNGLYIGQGMGEAMINGNGLSPGEQATIWKNDGMRMPGGALILPVPERDNFYIVLHGQLELEGTKYYCSKWFYSMVDMDQQNGQGAVIEKNVEILSDTLAVGNLSATRHGNGRDWWLLIPRYNSNKYYRFLLTPEGLLPQPPQAIGTNVEEGLGQAIFSPDGTKYARNELVQYGQVDIVSLYDFDRCSGLLSNDRHIAYADSAWSGGLAFSPNSELLYIPHFTRILQMDTKAPDILSTLDTVAIWDTFYTPSPPFATYFYLASLTPEGKIYISSPGGTDRLHVIHQPNEKGEACNIEQNGIELPVYNFASLPTYPNFRLGPWEGSPCDSIEAVGISSTFSFSKVFIYPNPASEYVIFDNRHTTEKITRIAFYNNMGEIISEKKWESDLSEYKMDVSGLSLGIYFYSVFGEENILKSGKVIIQRE